MSRIKDYYSLIKFSHTIFAMPFAMIGFFLGVQELINHNPSEYSFERLSIRFLLVILCMVFARTAAMAFNRFLDREFDAKNPRTAIREIPAGIISGSHVLIFTIISSLLFIICTFFINRICFYLSPVALFVVLFYSYTKRFTALCHLVLGLGLSLAPIGAYLSVTGYFSTVPILFSLVVIFWVSGFDIIYALQDEQFDKENKLYSIPSLIGKKKALRFSSLLHVLSTICVIGAGIYGNFGWSYWLGIAVFCGMLVYQHSIVKPDDLRRVNLAFMTANGIASVIFSVLVLVDLATHAH
jgi:4-hydroxybenzoate polyprenyltransferase